MAFTPPQLPYQTRGAFFAEYPEGPSSLGWDLLLDIIALGTLPSNRAEKRWSGRNASTKLPHGLGRKIRKTANWMNPDAGLGTRYRQARRQETPEFNAEIDRRLAAAFGED
jgi:hypothetical protein